MCIRDRSEGYFTSPEKSLGGSSPVSKLMYGLHLHQKELQQAFNLSSAQGQTNYVNWFVSMASDIYGVDTAFAEAARQRLRSALAPDASSLPTTLLHKSWVWFARWSFKVYRWNPGLAMRVCLLYTSRCV